MHSPPLVRLEMPTAKCIFFLLVLVCRRTTTTFGGASYLGSVGSVVDYSSPASRVQIVTMEMALEDYERATGNRIDLHVRDSQGDPFQAALEAEGLINRTRVCAIFGLQTWQETATVARLGNKAQVPVVTLAEGCPSWCSEQWPFLVQATHSRYLQFRAMFAIVRSWQWRSITIIYEDTDYTATNIIPQVMKASQELSLDIDFLQPISTFSSFPTVLERLKNRQCRVFIVHARLALAAALFAEAEHMDMMVKDYAWIMTTLTSDMIESANSSVVASMQGVIGIRSYFSHGSAQLSFFYKRFSEKFRSKYPKEVTPQPDVYGFQSYDAMWAVAQAMGRVQVRVNVSSFPQMERNNKAFLWGPTLGKGGNRLLRYFLKSKFSGVSGDIYFIRHKLAPLKIFEIINIVGRSFRDMGYWTETGFSKAIDKEANYCASMTILGQVFWPGGAVTAPGGWASPATANPLIIGVPAMSAFPDYVAVKYDQYGNQTLFSGLSIDIFNLVVDQLPFHLPYSFVSYHGTYESMVKMVAHKKFDAVVGDTSILSYRCQYVEFSQPYSESGIMMVVLAKPTSIHKAWAFIKPFTASLWASIVAISIYNSLVIWLMERNHNRDFQGSSLNQIGSLVWLAFTTLFPNGERLHHNLSRLVMLVWLFAGLVFTSSYTANLSSMLTVRRLEANGIDVDFLKRTSAGIGCNMGSSVVRFLKDVLEIHPNNIKEIPKDHEYLTSFKNGSIKAAFFKVPHGKVFLAKYCKDFTAAGPIYTAGGFGFVFPKGSHIVPDITEAIMKVFESGKMQEMENGLLTSYNCSVSSINDSSSDSLDLSNFMGLFAVMTLTTSLAILFFGCSRMTPRSLYRTTSGALLTIKQQLKDSRDSISKRIMSQLSHSRESTDIPAAAHDDGRHTEVHRCADVERSPPSRPH